MDTLTSRIALSTYTSLGVALDVTADAAKVTAFAIVYRLVTALAVEHSKGHPLDDDAYKAYAAARRALLGAHGWDEHEFEARLDDYMSDCDCTG
jgi:hypothetical protein